MTGVLLSDTSSHDYAIYNLRKPQNDKVFAGFNHVTRNYEGFYRPHISVYSEENRINFVVARLHSLLDLYRKW